MTMLQLARFARISMISVVCPVLFTLSAHGFDGRRDPTEVSALAAHGDRDAMFVLGSMYANGRGVVENDALANEWYRKAAALGEPRAMANLGAMYARGEGVRKNDDDAMRWYRQAAEAGNLRAMTTIGARYASGAAVVASGIHHCH